MWHFTAVCSLQTHWFGDQCNVQIVEQTFRLERPTVNIQYLLQSLSLENTRVPRMKSYNDINSVKCASMLYQLTYNDNHEPN